MTFVNSITLSELQALFHIIVQSLERTNIDNVKYMYISKPRQHNSTSCTWS